MNKKDYLIVIKILSILHYNHYYQRLLSEMEFFAVTLKKGLRDERCLNLLYFYVETSMLNNQISSSQLMLKCMSAPIEFAKPLDNFRSWFSLLFYFD